MGERSAESTWMSKEKCLKLQKRFGPYETYEATGGGRGENKKTIIRVLKHLTTTFTEKPSVLEIGSGPGHFLWVMKDDTSSITGIDVSPHMIELSKDVFQKNKIDANFIEGSCWKIPLDDNSYDLVFQVDVCMHVGRSYEALLEMIRVSKRYVLFTGPSFEKDRIKKIDRQISRLSWAISVPLLNDELEKLITKGIIKKYSYYQRPPTQTYNHKILVIEK